MRFVKDGEKFAATKENQRGDVVDHVEKADRRRDEHETQQEQGPRFVHIAQQAIERDAETDKNNLPDKIAEDRQSKHGFVREDVVGGGAGVPTHDEFARNVDQAERRGEYHRQINRAGDTSCFLGWMHGFQLFNFQFLLAS